MELFAIVFAFLLCIVLPIALVVGLIVWLVRRGQQPAVAPAQPVAELSARATLYEFEQLLAKWQAAGQLPDATVQAVRALIAQERRAAPAHGPGLPNTPPAPAAAPPALVLPSLEPVPAVPALAAPVMPAPRVVARPSRAEQIGGALLSLRTRQTVLFLGAFLLVISALILIVFNWASFPPILQFTLLASVCGGFWWGGAWLIRQTELDRAGAGLQAVGGLLVPVVAFSLSRPGLLELAPRNGWLLASLLCLPIYALAAWRLRRPLFVVAGCVSAASAVLAGLGAVGNQWLPLALAITLTTYLPLARFLRQRAPDLAAGPYWVAHAGVPLALAAGTLLMISDSMSLGVFATLLWAVAGFYLLAATLERLPRWAWIAAVIAPAALIASLNAAHVLADEWLPLALIVALAAYLPLARALRRQVPILADPPFWVAQAGVVLALAFAIANGAIAGTATALAATLWVGASFYLLALLLDRRPGWAWPIALLVPAAVLATLAALEAPQLWRGVIPALVALVYLGLTLALEPRFRRHVLPGYAGAALLMLMTVAPMTESGMTARWSLPLLISGLLAITVAYERGRLAWLQENNRLLAATFGLASAGVLIGAWAWEMLHLTGFNLAQRGLLLMPLAGLFLIGAAHWPGSARRSYDWALQALGVALALGAGVLALGDQGYQTAGMAALTAIWAFQALQRRHWAWATAGLGNAILTGLLWLQHSQPAAPAEQSVALGLAFAALYLVGGPLLRRTSWRFVSWPAIGWGALAAAYTLSMTLANLDVAGTQGWHVLALLGLAGVVALAGALWRAAWPGFAVAALLALAMLLAASRGFFTGWQLAEADFAYVFCCITLGLALVGQALRRVGARYAYPYEIVGFALLTFAPLPTIGDAQHATLTWAAMLLLYALASRLYQLRWASALALLALDMALLNGTAWLVPGVRPAGAGVVLLLAAWVQGALGLWWSLRSAAAGRKPALFGVEPAYVVALISGSGALAIASRADDVLMIVAFGLAALLALVSSAHRRAAGAWGALGLLALHFAALHRLLLIDPQWSMAWGVAEALGLCLLGWLIEWSMNNARAAKQNGGDTIISNSSSALSIWSQPLSYGPLAAGAVLTSALLTTPLWGELPALTFALATYALLLATLAVRRRASEYAYAAGAALIGAGLVQIYDWGFRQPQWFVIPAGLYLLALAEGLRHFQGQRKLSQLIETGALTLMLGISFGQSLRAEGLESQAYAAWLCVEALLLLGYGVLGKLRAPFLGGAGFFIAGVLWLSASPLMALNKWVLLGLLGLLLVGIYVLLERRQQELARAGRALIERVSSWG